MPERDFWIWSVLTEGLWKRNINRVSPGVRRVLREGMSEDDSSLDFGQRVWGPMRHIVHEHDYGE